MSSHNLSLFDEEALPASASAPAASPPNAPARVQMPNRSQLELRPTNLDEQLEDDHRARLVWAYVERLDLSKLYARIRAVEGGVGRTPIAPEILLSLWLYATLESLGSARA
ncbi:transposase, partial [Duganella sp. 1411]|nr:transposase [Duganella sp. 1411]